MSLSGLIQVQFCCFGFSKKMRFSSEIKSLSICPQLFLSPNSNFPICFPYFSILANFCIEDFTDCHIVIVLLSFYHYYIFVELFYSYFCIFVSTYVCIQFMWLNSFSNSYKIKQQRSKWLGHVKRAWLGLVIYEVQ